MTVKKEINQIMRQKYSLENCKKQYVKKNELRMNIRDKLSYFEAQYKIPLHN